MATTPVPAFIAPPDFPALSDRASGTYNSKAFAWAEAMQDTTGPNIHALAVTAKANADDAAANATLADADRVQTGLDREQTTADRVQTGLDRVQTGSDRTAAAASAVQASKLSLGNKATPPTLDNQGEALLAGVTYYDTALNKWRVWSGIAWADGISAIAGVSSINGQSGDLTLVPLFSYTYADRAVLRSLNPVSGSIATVDGLGLFVWVSGAGEIDDDESAFVTASGAWLLQAVGYDLVDSLVGAAVSEFDMPRILRGNTPNTIVMITSNASVSFNASIPGCKPGMPVVVSPPVTGTAGVPNTAAITAFVSSSDVVTVNVCATNISTVTLGSGEWKFIVFDVSE